MTKSPGDRASRLSCSLRMLNTEENKEGAGVGAALAAGSERATDTLILAIQGWRVPGRWAERHWPKVGKRPFILDHIVVLGSSPTPNPFPCPLLHSDQSRVGDFQGG